MWKLIGVVLLSWILGVFLLTQAVHRESPVSKSSSTSLLSLYTIYDHPKDFPGHWVVRRWQVGGGKMVATPDVWLCVSLAEARSCLPPGLTCVIRSDLDDSVIVETWL